jgi:hypothetical protein
MGLLTGQRALLAVSVVRDPQDGAAPRAAASGGSPAGAGVPGPAGAPTSQVSDDRVAVNGGPLAAPLLLAFRFQLDQPMAMTVQAPTAETRPTQFPLADAALS